LYLQVNTNKMDIKDVVKDEMKTTTITIRTFPSYSRWMKKNKVSPTKLFNEAVLELQQRQAENGLKKLANPTKKG